MNILLDTNSYSLFRGGDHSVKKEIYKSGTVYLSVVTVGELYAGFFRGNRLEENINLLRNFIEDKRVAIFNISIKTSAIYGKITLGLYSRGDPIPTNDVWIAAQAVETGSKLITYDRHFLKIPGLKVWSRLS